MADKSMKKHILSKIFKRAMALFIIVIINFNSYAAVVSSNDGSAFITKAEFDALVNDFNSRIEDYEKSIDAKIDGAIAEYLAGLATAVTTQVRFPIGAGEKAIVCTSNNITNLSFGKATLDFSFNIANLFLYTYVSEYANEGAGAITMSRTGDNNYEIFLCNSNGSKFEYYTNKANLSLTGAWNFITRQNTNGTKSTDNPKLRWHAAANKAAVLNRNGSGPGATNSANYDDRFDKFGFALIYGTELNWGNSWSGGVTSSERIMGTSTSVVLNVDDDDKVHYIFDNASANSRNWVWDPTINKDRVVASARGVYSTNNQQFDTPNEAGITTAGRILFRIKYYTATDWQSYQKNIPVSNSMWTTTGTYTADSTTVNSGKWFEFHLAPGNNPNTVGDSGEYQDTRNLIHSSISSSILSEYSPDGYTGAVTQGFPIGKFTGKGDVEFDIDTSTLSSDAVFAIKTSPFNPQSEVIDNLTTMSGITSILIDGSKKTNVANVISAGTHKIRFYYDFETPTVVYYKVAWPNSASTAVKSSRKQMTLPIFYYLTLEG